MVDNPTNKPQTLQHIWQTWHLIWCFSLTLLWKCYLIVVGVIKGLSLLLQFLLLLNRDYQKSYIVVCLFTNCLTFVVAVCLLSIAVSFLCRLTSEVIRSQKAGGPPFDIFGFKTWMRQACSKLADKINAVFCDPPLFISERLQEQDFRSTNFMISLVWAAALTTEVRGPCALRCGDLK